MDRSTNSAPNLEPGPEFFEEFLWDLFTLLIDLPGDRVDAEIRRAQRRVCEALDLDRSSLWQVIPADGQDLRLTHFYTSRETAGAIDERDGSTVAGSARVYVASGSRRISTETSARREFPWITDRVFAGLTTVVASPSDLPRQAARDADTLREIGTASTVIVPLKADERVLGGVTFASELRRRDWPPAIIKRFELVAQAFARALNAKRAADVQRQHAAQLAEALEESKRLREQLQHENARLRSGRQSPVGPSQIVGHSPAIRHVIELVGQVAPTGATVLVVGETGTGKGRLAALIHELSERAAHPMVHVNCAAIPPTLIESELFGREKGAYTGALTKQIGRFELAHGSTIFLDEIGDLPHDVQVKLLRVLDERKLERLGSPRAVSVDLRIIAATNQDLEREVRERRFREDLYYRLNVFPIRMPPLRERPEDIPLLARALVDELCVTMGRRIESIPSATTQMLMRHAWPGNVRELRNVLERAMITATGSALHIDLPAAPSEAVTQRQSLKDVERTHILSVLGQTGWRIRGAFGAAAALGLPPTTLENRMKKLGIARPGRPPVPA